MRSSGSVRAVMTGCVAGGVVSGALSFAAAALAFSSATVRGDLPIFRQVGVALHGLGFELLAISTRLSAPHDLNDVQEAALLLCLFVVVSGVLAVAIGLPAAAAIALIGRSWRRARATDGSSRAPARSRKGRSAVPVVGVVVPFLFIVPTAGALAAELRGSGLWAPVPILVIATGAALPLLVLVLCRLRGRGAAARRVLRFVARACGISLAVAGLAIPVLAHVLAAGTHPAVREAVEAADASSPNVLLISIDSLRADHLGSYGYERATSPNIDRLAREGVRYRTVVAPTTWTLPSHLTLLTGLPPAVHGVERSDAFLGRRAVSLPEIFRAAGYATAGFVSAPFVSARYGYAQGFDVYDDYSLETVGWVEGWAGHLRSHRGSTSAELARLVTGWIDRWHADPVRRPFFLFVHMWDVHHDYDPPPPYDTLFDPDYRGRVDGADFVSNRRIRPGMDPRDLEHVVALYDGEIRYTDRYLGRMIDHLEAAGELDRTVVIVTSDHGEEFFEHGEKGHHKNLYDETLLVPLILRYPPAVSAGAVVDRQVRLMDVAPTLLSLTGIADPERFGLVDDPRALAAHGSARAVDLAPTTPGGEPADTSLAATAALRRSDGEWFALRTRYEKLIVPGSQGGAPELYDLRIDPGEQDDLVSRRPKRAAALLDELRRVHAIYETESGDFSGALEIRGDLLERLRALGYVR